MQKSRPFKRDVSHRALLKMIIMTKLAVFLILLTAFQVKANDVFAQHLQLDSKNTEVGTILKEIEQQSRYRFLYNYDLPGLKESASIKLSSASIEEVLNKLFYNRDLSYRQVGTHLYAILPGTTDGQKNILVTGKVTNDAGSPVAGVSVVVKGTNAGTVTDASGNFRISVPGNDAVLIISSVGYAEQAVPVNGRTEINVVLVASQQVLDQVVVVGYGTQKKKDLTGAVDVIDSKDLENRPNTQFGYAIEGKAAGVQVVRSSGQPQAGFSIRVRGTSSITSNSDPLYIVDGVPSQGAQDINPSDIETITVLKDASSAAIYGSSGANGVVIITTKRGRNQKLQLGFNAAVTASAPWKKLNVLNAEQFKDLAEEMGATLDWSKYTANTNWQDETFRTALSQTYQLNAAGGTKKTSYYVSGSYINQNGIIINNTVKRATFKLNLDHQLTKWMKIGGTFGYANWRDVDVPENSRLGVVNRMLTEVPVIGIRDPSNPAAYARSPFINDIENPVSIVYQPDHLYKSNRYQGNAYIEISPVKDLKIKSVFGFEDNKGTYTSYQDSVQTRYGKTLGGLASQNDYKYKYWISENTANYIKKLGDHKFDVLAGYIVSREINDNLYQSSHDFSKAAPGDESVTAGAVQNLPIPEYSRISHMSFIGRVNYDYKNKYLLTSNFRADGSGQFAEGNRWGYFPSFSMGWRLSQEDFFRNAFNNKISELKIRVGWGTVGNDRAAPYAWYGLVDTLGRYNIGGRDLVAYTPTTIANPSLKWEKTTQTDIGIDLGVLDNRILLTADYYHKLTSNMLLNVPVPTSTGFAYALQNAGSMLNHGIEFQLTTTNVQKADFKWNTAFNISFNKNKVINIVGEVIPSGPIDPAGSTYNVSKVMTGMPLGIFYGKYDEGVDPETGMIRFKQTADGSQDSIGIIGNANPKFYYGFTNNLTYKSFSLSLFFQGVSGNQLFNGTKLMTESMALLYNQSATVLNRWTTPGQVTDIPKATPNDWDNSYPSTRYIEKGAYLRLKSLTVSYNLPQKFLQKLKMNKAYVYVTSENLLTFTKYSGFDPEVSAFSAGSNSTTDKNTAMGVDFSSYPQSRDFILGINLNF